MTGHVPVDASPPSALRPCWYKQEPCTVVSIDLYGELPKGKDGMVYVLSMQCPMSRYCAFAALPDKTAKAVAKAFYKTWIMRFGAPKVILSDSGGEFTSIDENTIAHLEEEYQCSHVFAADYSPTSNVVERVHQQLSRVLRIFVHKCGRAWSSCLDEAAPPRLDS